MKKFVPGVLVLALAVALFAGCGSSQTPKSAFEEFTAAARAKQYQKVYDMLSAKYRKILTLDDIKKNLTPPPEITIIETKTTGNEGFVRYTVAGDKTGTVYRAVLKKEGGVWKVDDLITETPTSSAPSGSTPASSPASSASSAP